MAPRARNLRPESAAEEVREGAASSPAEEKGERHMNKRRRGRMAGKERMMNREQGDSCGGKCSACKAGKPCSGMKKDGAGCGMKRGDALTPQEYLKACDLGIEGRSREYIRARLDAAQARADKKCGKSGVAPGKKCSKPTSTQGIERALKVGGVVGAVGALGAGVYQASRGNYKGAHNAFAASHGFSALGATGLALEGKRTGNKNKQRNANFALGLNATLAGANLAVARSTTNMSFGSASRPPRPSGSPAPDNRVVPVRVREVPNQPTSLTPATPQISRLPYRRLKSIKELVTGVPENDPAVVQGALRNSRIMRRTKKPRVGISKAPRVTGQEVAMTATGQYGREYAPNPRMRRSRTNELIYAKRKRSSRQTAWLDSASIGH